MMFITPYQQAVLAQSVERKALNLVVGGSSPPVGDHNLFELFEMSFFFKLSIHYITLKEKKSSAC
eukprot:scaffold2953_cov187-Ochromonas_danica.AAC.11